MSTERPSPHEWQWDDNHWGDSPSVSISPDQVPDPDDDRWAGWPAYLRRLMRWAR